MAVKINKGRALEGLSLTPMIDIVFLLLIFFLVTSKYEQEEHVVEINTPEMSEPTPIIDAESKILVVNQTGDMYLDGQKRAYDDIVKRLGAARLAGVKKVAVRADGGCEFNYVMLAITAVKKAKLEIELPGRPKGSSRN